MSQISQKSAKTSQSDDWETLLTVSLSDPNKITGHKKCIVLKQYLKNEGSDPLILADIRAFMNGRPTKVGVCLTSTEFNFLAHCLIRPLEGEKIYNNQSQTRSITIKPKKSSGVEINQRVDDKVRRLNLYKKEINIIKEKYGDFYFLIEEMEEKFQEVEDQDEVDTMDE